MALSRRRTTIGIVASALILIAFALWFKLRSSSEFSNERALLGRLPNAPAAVLSVDVALLRRAGLLNGRNSPVEPEYNAFLEGTGFEYRRDLDLLIASFSRNGNYFIARGRFDWKKLRSYAVKQGGACYNQLCRVQGSTPERRISFLPLRDNVLALAVSNNDLAATQLSRRAEPVTAPLPSSPVWMSVPGAALNAPGALPEGLRVSLSGLLDADRVLLTAGPGADGIEAHLEATCRTLDGARTLESQLRSAAAILKEAAAAQKKNGTGMRDDGSLGAVLSTGSFARNAREVTGTWRIAPAFVRGLTAGI